MSNKTFRTTVKQQKNVLRQCAQTMAGLNGHYDPKLKGFLNDLIPNLEIYNTNGNGSLYHNVQVLAVAKYMHEKGYKEVYAEEEEEVRDGLKLKMDLFAIKRSRNAVIEVETGRFLKNNHHGFSHDEREEYFFSRFIGKVSRYAGIGNEFFLTYPRDRFDEKFYNKFPVPLVDFFTSNPIVRRNVDIDVIKRYVDRTYTKPPIAKSDIKNAVLTGVILTEPLDKKILNKGALTQQFLEDPSILKVDVHPYTPIYN